MRIQSERAKEIDAYIDSHPDAEVGRWPIEIAGAKRILPFYRFPIDLLRYNVNNGRMAMEIRGLRKETGRSLDSSRPEDVAIIRKVLLELDPDQTKTLREDLHEKEQMEPGVITHDGFVVNGNRRMAVLEELHREEPTGKWTFLEGVRLPSTISEKDLWKIEAGLQLSQDKVAQYHPVNELLKIREGIHAGLSPQEVAAAMYGRTVDWVKSAIKRLDLIESFLQFLGQTGNYGVIKKFGISEYFVDIQKYVVAAANREGLPGRELARRLKYVFALIRAHIRLRSKKAGRKRKGITHWDVRKLGRIFSDAYAEGEFLKHFEKAKRVHDVPEDTVIDDFNDAAEVIGMKDQRYQPVRLIDKAIKALESIERGSEHFRRRPVKEAMAKLSKLVRDIEQELTSQSPAAGSE